MTSRDFAYWLQGFFEITDAKEITPAQTDLIKKHLNMVFYHEIDPSYSKDPQHLADLQAIHDGKKKENNEIVSESLPGIGGSNANFYPHSGHSGNVFPNEDNVLYRC